MNKCKILSIIGFFLFFSSPAGAVSSDQEQPIQIEANSASLDNQKGLTMYFGNVVITQGTLKLKAEKVTLTYDDKRQIDVVIAETEKADSPPVYFEQVLDNKELIRAEARLMEYHAKKDILHLKKSAKVWKNKDTITGDHIMYDAKLGKITAKAAQPGETGSGRVKVTIEPPK